jgi:hypothetical protein
MVDVVNIPATEVQAPAGHDQAMIDKANGVVPEPAPEVDPNRPAWLNPKFKSPEDLAKAYEELEKKQSQPPKQEDPLKVETDPKPEDKANESELPDNIPKADVAAFQQEFAEKGELSAESYEKLDKLGFGKDIVDAYIAGQEALGNQITTEVYSTVGGETAYGDLMQWAKTNLSESEKAAFNAVADSGSVDQLKLAVAGLKAKHTAAEGSEPNLLSGNTTQTQSGDVFESVQEVTAAMKDPRYKKDPAYRAKVQAKLGRSNVY